MMRRGYSVKTVGMGATVDLEQLANSILANSSQRNQRIGSEVYTRHRYFMIETVQMELGSIPYGPTMPIKQWIPYKPKNYKANDTPCKPSRYNNIQDPHTVSYGGIVEDDYGEESFP